MKKLLIAFFSMLLFANCNNQNAAENKQETPIKTANQNESPANASAEKSASIKIFKNDKLVVEYKALSPEGGITIFKTEEKILILKLSSDDNKYNLIVTLENTKSGTYSISKSTKGDASITLSTEPTGALPYLTNLTEGTLNLKIAGEMCSGNFTGSQKEQYSENIKVTCEFTSIPLIKQTSKY